MNKYFSVSFPPLVNSSQCLLIEYTMFFQFFLFFYMSFRLLACYPSDLLVGIMTVDPRLEYMPIASDNWLEFIGYYVLHNLILWNVKSLTWAWAFWLNNLDWSPGYSPPPPNVTLPSVLLLWTGTIYFCNSHYLQLSIMRRKGLLWLKSAYLWSFALCFVRHCWVNEEQEQNTEVISLSKAGKFGFQKNNYLGQVKYEPYRWCWIMLAKVYFIETQILNFIFVWLHCLCYCLLL